MLKQKSASFLFILRLNLRRWHDFAFFCDFFIFFDFITKTLAENRSAILWNTFIRKSAKEIVFVWQYRKEFITMDLFVELDKLVFASNWRKDFLTNCYLGALAKIDSLFLNKIITITLRSTICCRASSSSTRRRIFSFSSHAARTRIWFSFLWRACKALNMTE